MSFEKTKSAIAYLEKHEELTPYDIFNVFHNLCDDAEAVAQNKLEKIPCRNIPEDDLASSLMWCCKKITRVINKNKENISDTFYVDKLTKEIQKLNENIAVLEGQNEKAQELLKEQELLRQQERIKEAELAKTELEKNKKLLLLEEEARKQQEEEKQRLEAVKTQLDEKNEAKKVLLRECRVLQASIDSYESVDIPELENRKLVLVKQEKNLTDKIGEIQQELVNMEKTVADLKDKKINLDVDKTLQKSTIQKLKEDCNKLEDDITKQNKEISELEEDIKNKSADYQIEKAGLERLGSKQRELIEAIAKLREDQAELNIGILTTRKSELTAEYERKKREYEAKEKEIEDERQKHLQEYKEKESSLEAEKQAQLKEIKEQEEALEDKKNADIREVEIKIAAKEAKEKAGIAEYEQKLTELKQKEAEIERQKQAQLDDIVAQEKKNTDAIAAKEKAVLDGIAAKEKAILDAIALKEKREKDAIAAKEKAEADAIEKQKKAVQDRITEKENRIADEKLKHQKLEEDFANKSLELNKAIEETKEKLSMIKSALETLEKQKKMLNLDVNEAGRERDKLEKWFNGIEAAQKNDTLATLRSEIRILREAKRNLDEEFGNGYYMDSDTLEEKMQEYRRYFAQTLVDVEAKLKEYCDRYAIVSNIIYGGGK